MYSSSRSSRRNSGNSLVALIGAVLVGTAASVIHGAFDRVVVDARRNADVSVARRGVSRSRDALQKEPSTSPDEISARGWWDILKRTFAEVNNDRVLAVAAGVTFYGLLSLFPAITVLVSVYGLFAEPQTISQHLQLLASFLPEGAMSIIGEQVKRIASGDPAKLGLAAIAGLLIALWSANSAIKALMDALNIAYDVEEKRSFIWLNVVSLLFTISSIIGLIVMFALVAVVPAILSFVGFGSWVDWLIWAGRWPVSLLLVLLALACLYQWGPSRPDVQWRWITPGSIVAAIGLLIFSMLFSWYAANFGKFNETYGSLGAAIGFMTWLWLSATIVLVGAELNAEIENKARPGGKPGEEPGSQKA